MPLLEVRNLETQFKTQDGVVKAVNNVSFSVDRGETLGIVGESGSGKTITALSLLRLVQNAEVQGSAVFQSPKGEVELLGMPERRLRGIRGQDIAMIFQEPMTALNPLFTVGNQIEEILALKQGLAQSFRAQAAIKLLADTGITEPERRAKCFPYQLSGGQRQRVMIAMALACKPKLLLADEPTTALDVTIQAQILELMRTLQQETGTAIILITHDLGVVAEVADEVLVMYSGRVVERAPVNALFETPQHPYTVGLLGSIPRLEVERTRLASIEGQVPSPLRRGKGCSFADRCPYADIQCRVAVPELRDVGAQHQSACFKAPLDPDQLVARHNEAALA